MNIYWLYWPLLAVFVNWDDVRAGVSRLRSGRGAAAEPMVEFSRT
jgi:hypothetical protein